MEVIKMRDEQEYLVYLELAFSEHWKILRYFYDPFGQLWGNDIDG